MADNSTLNERLSDIQKSVIETDIVYKKLPTTDTW